MPWLAEVDVAAKKMPVDGQTLTACWTMRDRKSAANRVAMPPSSSPAYSMGGLCRFIPCSRSTYTVVTGANPDEGTYIPLQERSSTATRSRRQIAQLPETFDGYLKFVARIPRGEKRNGGIAEKFEIAYFRSSHFEIRRPPPLPNEDADIVPGIPSAKTTRRSRDYLFRYLVRQEDGRLHLPGDISPWLSAQANGFQPRRGKQLNLEKRAQGSSLPQYHVCPAARRLSILPGDHPGSRP